LKRKRVNRACGQNIKSSRKICSKPIPSRAACVLQKLLARGLLLTRTELLT